MWIFPALFYGKLIYKPQVLFVLFCRVCPEKYSHIGLLSSLNFVYYELKHLISKSIAHVQHLFPIFSFIENNNQQNQIEKKNEYTISMYSNKGHFI